MGSIGLSEILLILLALLIVFGPSRIPQLGDAIGKGIKNFKKATRGDDSIDVTPRTGTAGQMGTGAAPTTPAAGNAPAAAEAKKS
jgi:sec-independent protein translocase protein TatA